MDLRRFARRGEGLEGLEAATPAIGVDLVKRRLGAVPLASLPDPARSLIQDSVPEALEQLGTGQPLTFKARLGLEALVRVDGRPALVIREGLPDLDTPEAGRWKSLLGDYTKPLQDVIDAVGRIELAGVHVGTGFLVAPGLVLTNRHVAEVIAKAYALVSGEVWLMKAGAPLIDFDREAGSLRRRRFRITSIAAAGSDPIQMRVDPRNLDAALLAIAPAGLDERPLPQPVTFLHPGSLANEDPGEIVSIGYPGAPGFEPRGPIPTGEEQAVMSALKRIFSMTYGVKRLSPGEIITTPGHVQDGGKKWVFTHDATTLGGASGSCIVRLSGGTVRVMGLHFGGAWLKHNFAHLTARLKDPLLTVPEIEWKA